MQEFAESIWRRFGASVVWDPNEIQAATEAGAVTVSLREALGWIDDMPPEPPSDAPSVLVTGLETALDVLSAVEAQALLERTRRLVRSHSRHWGECGLAFLASGPSRYVVMGQGGLAYRRGDGVRLDLGRGIWGGNQGEVGRLVATQGLPNGTRKTVPVGYWLRRVS